ncbi:hypothetical protein BJX61DRAFT_516802 [Aspergillus egyptiacus]|nr:hypothetical protein BJX61DRAFT_516802 [Aspergillus egyptiacus]
MERIGPHGCLPVCSTAVCAACFSCNRFSHRFRFPPTQNFGCGVEASFSSQKDGDEPLGVEKGRHIPRVRFDGTPRDPNQAVASSQSHLWACWLGQCDKQTLSTSGKMMQMIDHQPMIR